MTTLNGCTVVKLGGSILKDGPSYLHAAAEIRKITEQAPIPPIVVVSAMKGVTDELLRVCERGGTLDAIEHKHLEAARYIGDAKLERLLIEHIARLKSIPMPTRDPIVRDAVLSFGELLSKLLLTEALRAMDVRVTSIDAREVIKTDCVHGGASIDYRATYVRLAGVASKLVIEGITPTIEGFVGSTRYGAVTTLGRGGSDYTATTIAALLGAGRVHLVTDVPGIMSADPKYVSSARIVREMQLDEAAEAAFYGCKGLHPRTFHPLRVIRKVKVVVGGWRGGTEISEGSMFRARGGIKLVTFRARSGLAHVALIGGGVAECGLMAKILDLIDASGLHPRGFYMVEGRPSMVFLFGEDEVPAAIHVLHKVVLEVGGDNV